MSIITYLTKAIPRILCILVCCLIPYLGTTERWKNEYYCRTIIKAITGRDFVSVRPDWLQNPMTKRNLELDCYNDELALALEYNGRQHYEYTPSMHSSVDAFESQVYRDEAKKALCRRNGVDLIIVPYTVCRYTLCSYIMDKVYKVRSIRKSIS